MVGRLAAGVFALMAAGLAGPPATPQQSDEQSVPSGKGDLWVAEFIDRLKSDLSEFVMVFPEDTRPAGDWVLIASITSRGEKHFEESATITAEDMSTALLPAAPYPVIAVRFRDASAIGGLIEATEGAIAETKGRYGEGSSELQFQLRTPPDFHNLKESDWCQRKRQMYFDIFLPGDGAGEYRRVDFADDLRMAVSAVLLMECAKLGPAAQPPRSGTTDPA